MHTGPEGLYAFKITGYRYETRISHKRK